MSSYNALLDAYLSRDGNTEKALADAVNKTQPAIHRYRKGERFPDADTARQIDQITAGEVPFGTWHSEFLAKSGLAA